MDDTRSRIRRQRSQSPTREIAAEMSPLNGQGGGPKRSNLFAIGSFLVPPSMFQIKVRDKKDATAKKKFQVNVPTRMLVILGFVFCLMPLLVFFYKEKHLHEDHHEPHFKQHKFVNVDKEQAMANFVVNQNHTSEQTSLDENETSEKSSKDELPEAATKLAEEESEMINATTTIDAERNATKTNQEKEKEGPPIR
ncbi:unnamed protein product [Cylindrotheca closterium]|uniref:Uncharacterized protein n=1 Tax=Cylindrotheca closterium TaxID=2856 RepID=A0AAD2FQL7_9STRA|nr:unnamed protein product [Cylindrotheca closterium]